MEWSLRDLLDAHDLLDLLERRDREQHARDLARLQR
jgi:hypothetical protein